MVTTHSWRAPELLPWWDLRAWEVGDAGLSSRGGLDGRKYLPPARVSASSWLASPPHPAPTLTQPQMAAPHAHTHRQR